MTRLVVLGCLALAASTAVAQERFSLPASARSRSFTARPAPADAQSATRPVLDDRQFDPLRATPSSPIRTTRHANNTTTQRTRPAVRLTAGRVAETTGAGPQLTPADGRPAARQRPSTRTSAESPAAARTDASSPPRTSASATSRRTPPREPRPLKIARRPQRSLPSHGGAESHTRPGAAAGRNVFVDSPILGYARDAHLRAEPQTAGPTMPTGGMNAGRRRALGW